jgi:hypothetical protein
MPGIDGAGLTGIQVRRGTKELNRFLFRFLLAAVAVFSFLCPCPLMGADSLITIGYTEDVMLLPWGIRLPARIDTGASMTSLDARSLTIRENMVAFRLPEAFGEREFELPIVRWGNVSSSMGVQRRPVVELDLCVGAARLKVTVNLNDRSGVRYPLIIGRNLLRNRFLVDSGKARLLPPSCSGSSPR